MPRCLIVAILAAVAGAAARAAAPRLETMPSEFRITSSAYRVTICRASADVFFELKDAGGEWFPVARAPDRPEFGLPFPEGQRSLAGARARTRHAISDSCVAVGLSVVTGVDRPATAELHLLCVEDGVLVGFRLPHHGGGGGVCWPLPRFPLDVATWDRYAFWDEAGRFRAGAIAALGDRDRYAGVSPWGRGGDTADRLNAAHPAVIVEAGSRCAGLAAVFVRYDSDWNRGHAFVQRHRPDSLFFYPGLAPATAAQRGLWAWLAPMRATPDAASAVRHLVARGGELLAGFRAIAPPADPDLLRPVEDVPAHLRRDRPVEDIRDAIVYTVNEFIHSDHSLRAASTAGPDVLIRGWFKWRDAPDWQRYARFASAARAFGALFGGGVTCSALYHGENALDDARVLDMATRGPDGRLVDAWGQPGIRHGTLSNPAYLEYILSFCRAQIDAGADYLFMDEINAALQADEGFDDYSLRDFRRHLAAVYCDERGWTRADPRWREVFGIDPADETVCPGGGIDTFDYRAYLRTRGLTARPHARENPLAPEWSAFRRARDDRAWKWMTDRIREHAASRGRRVFISGNGLARYVDVQVLGVWGLWKAKDGRIDLSESFVERWAGTVTAGRAIAGGPVPVVFFHDWGFGGFPWVRDVPPAERELWMRVRGAEIYASGALFAFPVSGPWNNDAMADGTIREIARQSRFYRLHRDLYLGASFASADGLQSDAHQISATLWRRCDPPALMVHLINRQARDSRPVPRRGVDVLVPTATAPSRMRIVSPDWEGERPGDARMEGSRLRITVPELEAYAVAILDYPVVPDVRLGPRRIAPMPDWAWIPDGEIVIGPDGLPASGSMPAAFLHGGCHAHLRRPHVFAVHLPRGGTFRACVGAVAILGARLECQIDDDRQPVHDLPDLDRANDPEAAEYTRVIEWAVPPGRHRITVQNTGGDWARMLWYSFDGELAP